MAKNSITDYDNIAANNTDIQSVDIDEGCAPSGINNAIRELMADLADVNDGTVPLASPDINGGTIDGVTIGGTTAGAGTFTTVTAGAGTHTIGDGTDASQVIIKASSATAATLDFGDADDTNIGRIQYDNTDNSMLFRTNNSEAMRIDSSGAVLVNSTASRSAGGYNPPALQVESTNFNSFNVIENQNTASGPAIMLSKSRGTTVGSNTVVQNGDVLGTIRFTGADGTDLRPIGAEIYAAVDGTPGNNDMPGRLVFATGPDGQQNATERMRIDSSGNVNIYGTDSRPLAITSFDTVSAGAGWDLDATSSNGVVTMSTGGTERMRIDSSGNVGIGTTSIDLTATGRTVVQVEGSSNALLNITDGTSRLYLHQKGGTSGADIWNSANSYMRFATNDAERMRIDSSGHIMLGTTSTSANDGGISAVIRGSASGSTSYFQFRRNNSTTAQGTVLAFFHNGSSVGTVTHTNTSTQYNTSSDYRLKEDMQPMTGAIERVNALNPVNFAWKADGGRVDGFLAHEAQAVVPEAVTGTKDAMQDEEYEVTPAVLDEDGNVVTEAVIGTRSVPDYQGIDQSKLVPLLTAALQEAIAKIETLETKVAALENA